MDESIEICRDLKRLAGLVNVEGWYNFNNKAPVGGVVYLSGPALVHDIRYLELGIPGYYSRKEIQEAYDVMYGRENLPKPRHMYLCFEDSPNLHGELIERFVRKRS